jgi:hypothetical protein
MHPALKHQPSGDGLRFPNDDRSSRQLITYSPERRSRRSHTAASEHIRERANDAERSRRNAGNAASDVLGCRVRDGIAMTASSPSPIAESASRTLDTDAQVRHMGKWRTCNHDQRLRAMRAQKRCEQREFKAWLQTAANPFLVAVVSHPDGQTMCLN